MQMQSQRFRWKNIKSKFALRAIEPEEIKLVEIGY